MREFTPSTRGTNAVQADNPAMLPDVRMKWQRGCSRMSVTDTQTTCLISSETVRRPLLWEALPQRYVLC